MKDDLKCKGIYIRCDALIFLISAIGLLPLLTVNIKSTLTLENKCQPPSNRVRSKAMRMCLKVTGTACYYD